MTKENKISRIILRLKNDLYSNDFNQEDKIELDKALKIIEQLRDKHISRQ